MSGCIRAGFRWRALVALAVASLMLLTVACSSSDGSDDRASSALTDPSETPVATSTASNPPANPPSVPSVTPEPEAPELRQPIDPFSASGLLSSTGAPVAIDPSGAYGYYASSHWYVPGCESAEEDLQITGYDVAAAEAGDPPLFDADPNGIVRRAAVAGSSLLDMAFVSGNRALVSLRCGSDVTVLDLTVDGAGRISGATAEVLLADIAAADAYVGSRLLVDEQALSIYRVDYPNESSDGVVTELQVNYVDGNRIESIPTSTLAVAAPGTDLRFATENTPFTGGEGGDSWRFIVDATDDGVDNFTPAEVDPWVRYSVGQLGPWFGPEERIVWLSTLERSASMSIGGYEADGHLIDVHNPTLMSASAWARGDVNPWRVAFVPDGRILVLGNVRTFYGLQGAPGAPAHAWYDPGADPEWLNSESGAPMIDWETPVVEFDDAAEIDGAPDWFLGQEAGDTVTNSQCSNTLFFDGPDGVERVLPTGIRLGEIADTFVGDRRVSEWSEVPNPNLEAWHQTVLVLARCPADGDGYRLWSFGVSPTGVWASRSIGTVGGIGRLVGGETEHDVPQVEVLLEDGTAAVLTFEFFEPLDHPIGTDSAVTDQPITRAMIDAGGVQQIQTPYIHDIYAAVGRSLASSGFEPSAPGSHRATAIGGDFVATDPQVASLFVGVELEPVLSAYLDVENVAGVIFFYPPENEGQITKRLAFWCGTSLVSLTSTRDDGAPYDLDELRAFAAVITASCPR